MNCVNWILVPIDFSKNSKAALQAADDQAALWNSGLILLHVSTMDLREALGPSNARQTLVSWAQTLDNTPKEKVAFIFSRGDAAEKILLTADQYKVRAIFMGQGGKDDRPGSIAAEVTKKFPGKVELFINAPLVEDPTSI